jgi:hypothetical protein
MPCALIRANGYDRAFVFIGKDNLRWLATFDQ